LSDHLNREFVQIFLEEARDLLYDWERHCIAMGVEPSAATCDALFRTAHNLKGSARSVGLERFGKTIHKAEDLITLVREGKSVFSAEIGRALLDAQALLSEWRDRLTADPTFVPQAHIEAVERRLAEVSGDAHAAEAAPAAFGFFDEPVTPPAAVTAAVRPPEVAGAASAGAAPRGDGESVRVLTSKIDALMQLVGELAIQQATIAHHVKSTEGMSPEDLRRQCSFLRVQSVRKVG